MARPTYLFIRPSVASGTPFHTIINDVEPKSLSKRSKEILKAHTVKKTLSDNRKVRTQNYYCVQLSPEGWALFEANYLLEKRLEEELKEMDALFDFEDDFEDDAQGPCWRSSQYMENLA